MKEGVSKKKLQKKYDITIDFLFGLFNHQNDFNLTEHFEEELPLLRSCLVGGLAGVGPTVALSDVVDR